MEIGSDFDLNINDLSIKKQNLFEYLSLYNCLYLDSGRSAIKYVLSKIEKKGTILLPEYICESVIRCFPLEKIKFYKIDKNFNINIEDLLDKINKDTAIIYLVNYFGAIQPYFALDKIKKIAINNNVIIIEDTTHSILSKRQTIGDYMVCSIRKWMPVSRAGVVYSKLSLEMDSNISTSSDNQRICGFLMKHQYINRNSWNPDFANSYNSLYRSVFLEDEREIDEQVEPKLCSDLSKFIISCFDVNSIKHKRRQNYKILENILSSHNIIPAIKLSEDECPFSLVIRVNERDTLRAYLIDHHIYCAVHWPFDDIEGPSRSIAVLNSKTLLSIPIDQRYGESDMYFIADNIIEFGGE